MALHANQVECSSINESNTRFRRVQVTTDDKNGSTLPNRHRVLYLSLLGDHNSSHYKQAASNGDKELQYLLGTLYRKAGTNVRIEDHYKMKKMQRASDWYLKAQSSRKYSDLVESSSNSNDTGSLDSEEIIENFTLERDLKEAKKGHVNAQYRLGQYYRIHRKDLELAYKWYSKAAEQGHCFAQYNLGVIQLRGHFIEKNDTFALEMIMKAADQGLSTAQHALGNFYFKGQMVSKNLNTAFEWYEKAANQGFSSGQSLLGECYEMGWGIPKDFYQAFHWYSEAALQGEKYAQYRLGKFYENGIGCEKDESLAFHWLSESSKNDFDESHIALAKFYDTGNVVEKNETMATELLRKAALQGNDDAQYRLAIRYRFGRGVAKDEKEALNWMAKSIVGKWSKLVEYHKNSCSRRNVILLVSSLTLLSSVLIIYFLI